MRAAMLRLASEPDLRIRMREHNASTKPCVSWPEVLTLHENVYAIAVARASRQQTSGPSRRTGSPVTNGSG